MGTVKRSAFVQMRPVRRFSEDYQMKDEALRMALEALESCDQVYGSEGSYQYFSQAVVDKAITAIKQALAAPVQDTEAHYKGVVEGVQKLFDDKRAQPAPVQGPYSAPVKEMWPAVPDAIGPNEDELPAYAAGWNDCRAEMLRGMK
jgi:hypothetical protein